MALFPESFDREDFLRNYWQKKPLLIRGRGGFQDPISPEELAGLACEDFVESRLISYSADPEDWQMRQGPFQEEDFLSLPTSNYSLLVQAVDHWNEGVKALLRNFDFIPSWRIDDLMISYSTDGGNVGPHFDYYDVFLIQGLGQKKWQTGARCTVETSLRQNKSLRLLEQFTAQQEWLLEPGDILYIPPQIAHYGIAAGNSMTYSVGFRAPSHAEILTEVADALSESLSEDQRYVDENPAVPTRSGEIPDALASQLISLLQQHMNQPERIKRWFGETMTSPKYPDISVFVEEALSATQLATALQQGHRLLKSPASRFAFTENQDKLELYADGTSIDCPKRLLELVCVLCAQTDLPEAGLPASCSEDPDALALLSTLHNQGSLLME